MSENSSSPLISQIRDWSRSMGLKLVLVCGIALLMTIPVLFVDNVVEERNKRAKDVMDEISSRVGGQQTFLGPTLTVPYSVPPAYKNAVPAQGVYVVFPAEADATLNVRTEERRRSLFRVPVYQSELNFGASFDLANVPSAAPAGAQLDWSRAQIVVGASDARGALDDGTITANGKTVNLVPIEDFVGSSEQRLPLAYFGARIAEGVQPNTKFNIAAKLHFSGAQRIAVLCYGKSTHFLAEGDWSNPGFDGGFIPTNRSLSEHHFTAEWSVPFMARGAPVEGVSTVVSALSHTALGISFVEVVDPYQSVSRALKYALLFVGLLFMSYFVFEATTGKRVHPAQYVLVGTAQMIFYLLLLSLAERIGFDWSFLVAGGATVILLSANANWIFASRRQGWRALFVFSLLYVFNYLLLRLEDNALLVGAVASFLSVAAVMYFTRNIDWYGSIQTVETRPAFGKDVT